MHTKDCVLLERTRELLRERPVTKPIVKIARDTGIGVAFLHGLAHARHPNPGVRDVVKLYEYLSGKQLTL